MALNLVGSQLKNVRKFNFKTVRDAKGDFRVPYKGLCEFKMLGGL